MAVLSKYHTCFGFINVKDYFSFLGKPYAFLQILSEIIQRKLHIEATNSCESDVHWLSSDLRVTINNKVIKIKSAFYISIVCYNIGLFQLIAFFGYYPMSYYNQLPWTHIHKRYHIWSIQKTNYNRLCLCSLIKLK